MPDEDVVMIAIWEPIEYTLILQTLKNFISNLKIKAKKKGIFTCS